MVRDGYDEILRQLTVRALVGKGCDRERAEVLAGTAREVGPRKASLLAPEYHDDLQQSTPDRVASYIAQLFPGAGDPGLAHLLTIR